MGKLFLSLVLLTLAYVSSYAALVQPSAQVVRIHLKKGEFSTEPRYRFLSDMPQVAEVAGEFYRPLFLLDTQLRPDYWEPMMFGMTDAKR